MAEDDDHEQHEEEHAVDGVAGAPLEAEVFAEMVEDVAERSSLCDSVGSGFGEVGEGGVGGAEIVGGGEDELEAALAGGDGDDVEEFDGLVGEGGEGLARAHDGDSAADVAGEGLDVFEGSEFGFFGSGGVGEFFQVEFGVAGDDGEEVLARRWCG